MKDNEFSIYETNRRDSMSAFAAGSAIFRAVTSFAAVSRFKSIRAGPGKTADPAGTTVTDDVKAAAEKAYKADEVAAHKLGEHAIGKSNVDAAGKAAGAAGKVAGKAAGGKAAEKAGKVVQNQVRLCCISLQHTYIQHVYSTAYIQHATMMFVTGL